MSEHHPHRETLEGFLLSRLPAAEAKATVSHLLGGCERCQDELSPLATAMFTPDTAPERTPLGAGGGRVRPRHLRRLHQGPGARSGAGGRARQRGGEGRGDPQRPAPLGRPRSCPTGAVSWGVCELLLEKSRELRNSDRTGMLRLAEPGPPGGRPARPGGPRRRPADRHAGPRLGRAGQRLPHHRRLPPGRGGDGLRSRPPRPGHGRRPALRPDRRPERLAALRPAALQRGVPHARPRLRDPPPAQRRARGRPHAHPQGAVHRLCRQARGGAPAPGPRPADDRPRAGFEARLPHAAQHPPLPRRARRVRGRPASAPADAAALRRARRLARPGEAAPPRGGDRRRPGRSGHRRGDLPADPPGPRRRGARLPGRPWSRSTSPASGCARGAPPRSAAWSPRWLPPSACSAPSARPSPPSTCCRTPWSATRRRWRSSGSSAASCGGCRTSRPPTPASTRCRTVRSPCEIHRPGASAPGRPSFPVSSVRPVPCRTWRLSRTKPCLIKKNL